MISLMQRPLYDNTQQKTSMALAGFKPAILASESPQTHALSRAATGISIGILFATLSGIS